MPKPKKAEKENATVKAIKKDRNTYAAIEELASSAGGKILVDNLVKDVVISMDSLALGYKKLSHAELLGLCASLENRLAILRLITRAKTNKDLADLALREELLRIEEEEE